MKEEKNLKSYLTNYKDITIKDSPLNEIDFLYFSLLAYINLPELKTEVTYERFCEMFLKQQETREKYGSVVPRLVEFATLFKDSKRYKDAMVKHYIYIIDNETQFGAMVFAFDKTAIVTFTGSDGSVIGWYENFRCSYQFPIYSQVKSKEYLLSLIDEFDEIYITGHSKGGNLAITSAMGLSKENANKIKGIYNFDGQGFFKEIIQGKEYKEIESKIVNYIPVNSYIGIFMHHGAKTKLVKTNTHGIGVHFQFNWCIKDKKIVRGYKLTFKSRQLHKLTTSRWDRLDKDYVSRVMENAINTITVDRTQKVKIGPKDIIRAIQVNYDKKLISFKDVGAVLKAFILADRFYK